MLNVVMLSVVMLNVMAPFSGGYTMKHYGLVMYGKRKYYKEVSVNVLASESD
jgi:hypothetical protein